MTTLAGVALVGAVAAATLAGGWLSLRWQAHSHLLLSFSAGTLVGLALAELIPEALSAVGGGPHGALFVVLGAFVFTMLMDKLHVLHPHPHGMEGACPSHEHVHPTLALPGAVGLVLHSAVDGLALAAALQQSPAVALTVALALGAHKFADGVTTVSLVLAHHHRRSQAIRLLVANTGALVLGVVGGLSLPLSEDQLAWLLLATAGFFLYLGASDLLPAVNRSACRPSDALVAAAGATLIALLAALLR